MAHRAIDAERDLTPTVETDACEQCGGSVVQAAVDQPTALCAECFDTYLGALEAPFLSQYARFGAKAHRTVAESLFRALAFADPDDRKVLGMRIVEEYLNAAAELIGLYTALRHRARRPVVESFLAFRLTAESVAEFRSLTGGRDGSALMRELGLPTAADVEGARGEIRPSDYRQFRTAVASVPNGLDRVARVEAGALLALAEGLHDSKTLAHRVDWIPGRSMRLDQVALLVLNQRRRVLLTHTLTIHEPQLEVFIDAIDQITGAARDLIWLYLHVNEVAAGR